MRAKSIFIDNASTAVITDPSTIIYTVPANTRAKWMYTFLKNASNNTVGGIDLEVFNGAQISVLSSKSFAAKEILELPSTGNYIMLEPGYTIRLRADTTNINCILTVEETTGLVSIN